MNLLGIQDALKNASDQQLMQLMQSPDSTAPSYLVLSELRRRKDMRAQQAHQPQGTVAQDLTKDDNTYTDRDGIRSLRMPGYEDEAQAAEEDAGGMREGGIVRMQGGGRSPYSSLSDPFPANPAEIDENLRTQLNRSNYLNSIYGSTSDRLGEITSSQNSESARIPLIANAMRDVRSLISSGMSPSQATQETLNSTAYRGKIQPSDLDIFGPSLSPQQNTSAASPASNQASPPSASATPPAVATPQATPPARVDSLARPSIESIIRQASDANAGSFDSSTQSRPAESPQSNTPGGSRAGGSRGGGGGPAPEAGIRALASGREMPNMESIMERNLGLMPGIPQELMDRLRASRTNEGDRRKEAQNMALIEAGLRIASSNNPRLGAAIAEGAAPAVQSYGQQLGQIRQDQRADLQAEMSAAQVEIQRRYMAGQISSAEYRSAMQEIGAMERTLIQQAGENARSRASLGSASAERALTREATAEARIGEGRATPAQIAAMSPEHRRIYDEQQAIRNPQRADVSGNAQAATGLGRRIDELRTALDSVGRPPPETIGWPTSRPNPAFAEYQQRKARLEAEYDFAVRNYQSAVGAVTAPRVNGPRVPGTGIPAPPPGFEVRQ